ncbi:TadE/TadG family type IV pilus assembly protein [Rhodopila sp.]|uniref:TadE/TadG family type IV pilus assembly protein n=1 Tax=Rhodopila sp. TaxID=2480087 RepID=UPI003D0FED79
MNRPHPFRLGCDRRGVAAIEFALVCMPFTLFLMAVLGVGLNFYLQQALDYATQAAARQVQLGLVPAADTQADFITKVFCPSFGQFQACGNLFVDLRPVTDYQQLTNPGVPDAPDSTATTGFVFCPGQPGQLMYMHVVYIPPSLGALFGMTPTETAMIGNASFANENPGGFAVPPAGGC